MNKSLPADTLFDSNEIVYAVLTESGWRCKVPQCGATLAEEFAIDMHLQAHGDTFLKKWYCGDSSCYSGVRKAFDDYDGFNLHIIDEHMGSSYSRAAGCRVPKGDVLVTTLQGQLNYRRIPIEPAKHQDDHTKASKAFTHTGMLEETAPSATQEDRCDAEELAWAKFRSTAEADKYSGSDDDFEFLQHCSDRYVFLSQAPRGMLPVILPPNYLVETLRGLTHMDERDARIFVKTYCKLCRVLGTNDKNELGKWLGLPLPDILVMDKPRNSAHETYCCEDLEPQGDGEPCESNQCFSCPWPECEYTSPWKPCLTLHFATVHLKCVWQCPEKGCEYCAYLSPYPFERHRMHCHIGSPLQCGHKECSQVRVAQPQISRGHMYYHGLRIHFETQFNLNLQNPRIQPSWLDSGFHYFSEVHEPKKPLLLTAEYMKRFSGGSSSYLSEDRRAYRRHQNYKLLAAHKIQPQNIEVRGSKSCMGFSYGTNSFNCADSINLGLDTAMLIFVPSKLLFTVTPTCDYCIHTMSLISRPIASLPPPMCFGPKCGNYRRERRGIGSTIQRPRLVPASG